MQREEYDTIIIGAGASGLSCAAEALRRGRRVAVLDHGQKAGRKILISGGGRANFTNLNPTPQNYICSNPHFVKSALGRYSPWDIIELLGKYDISWHEREHGQLFCDHSARYLVDALLTEAEGADIFLNCTVKTIEKDSNFTIATSAGDLYSQSLVIATGGLSIPKIGATNFGHKIAKQFGHTLIETRPGLVPLRYGPKEAQHLGALSGISLPVKISHAGRDFSEQLLFTHRGLSGPVTLQISNYWRSGESIGIDLLPDEDLENQLSISRQKHPKRHLKTVLAAFLPERLSEALCSAYLENSTVGSLSNRKITAISTFIHNFPFTPSGSEGYRSAEVTLGGVNTNEISSKSMESQLCPRLFFIGEVLDVTGHLGGFNFHWAWASGRAAGKIA